MSDTPQRPQGRAIRAKDPRKVAAAGAFVDAREPQLRLGDIVRLNSGGPPMMVVDTLLLNLETGEPIPGKITVAYRIKKIRGRHGQIAEWNVMLDSVHRVRDAW